MCVQRLAWINAPDSQNHSALGTYGQVVVPEAVTVAYNASLRCKNSWSVRKTLQTPELVHSLTDSSPFVWRERVVDKYQSMRGEKTTTLTRISGKRLSRTRDGLCKVIVATTRGGGYMTSVLALPLFDILFSSRYHKVSRRGCGHLCVSGSPRVNDDGEPTRSVPGNC